MGHPFKPNPFSKYLFWWTFAVFKRKDNLIGLDAGSQNIKMARVDSTLRPIKLMSAGIIPVPADAFMEGRINRVELVAHSIRSLASNLKIKDKFVAASVSGYEVMIKKVELPTLTEEELDNRMQAELGQYIPYNLEEVDVDYQILGMAKERPNQMEVLLVAAKKESIDDYARAIRLAGLQPRIMDVDHFALSNAYEATYGLRGDEVIALLDIGANKGIVTIISRGVASFTRVISIGGAQITELIGSRLKISFQEAEEIKLGREIEKSLATEIQNIFSQTIGKWVGEFRRVLDFYYGNFRDDKIEKVLLSGGSCRINGLDRAFQQALGIEVSIFNPLSRTQYDESTFDPEYLHYIGPQMAIALGLTLRKASER